MPERRNTFRVESDEVQGEGSFVVLRRQSWRDAQANARMLAELNGGVVPVAGERVRATVAFLAANEQATNEMLQKAVVAWNWVDDAGKPLPIPSEGDPDLNSQEVQFLVRALQPSQEALKN